MGQLSSASPEWNCHPGTPDTLDLRFRLHQLPYRRSYPRFLWPERSWLWGFSIAIPAVTLGVINIANSFSAAAFADTLINGAQAFVAGALMGWLGARFSRRRLQHGGSH